MPITVTANASGGVALGPAAAAAAEIAAASSPSVSRHSHQPALSYRSNVFAAALRSELDTTASRPVSWVVGGFKQKRTRPTLRPVKPVLRNVWNAVKHSFNRYSVIVIGNWIYFVCTHGGEAR